MKYYRDIKNVIDTAYEEAYGIAYVEGIEKGIRESALRTATQMKANGEPVEKIMAYTQLGRGEIENL